MAGRLDSVKAALDAAQEAGITGDPAAPVDHDGPGMPESCPVAAVGTQGGLFYYLSALGELRALKADQVANKHIVALFAPRSAYLIEQWPRKKLVKTRDAAGDEIEEWIVTGWRTDDVSMLLMDAAASKGVWDPRERVRGRGGWQAEDGSLVLHAGDRILLHGQWCKPGLYEDLVYPTQPAIPRPAKKVPKDASALAPRLCEYLETRGVEFANSAGGIIHGLFECWRYARPTVDPMLLTGWNAAAIYGGALDYRPLIWLAGDKATGKSHLQKATGLIHGNGILQSPDATEAAVRQILGQQSLPVAIDEAEADEDNRKMLALIKLARLAATSQGNVLRGGQDHEGHEFRATSCFLFSSILIPPIPPQDKSRLAVLELDEIAGTLREPPLDECKRELAVLGEQLRKDMADRWPLWRDRLRLFRNAMIDIGGHQGRTADQFGSLLAAAHLALSEAPPTPAELARWAELLGKDQLTEASDNASEATRCIERLVYANVQLTGAGSKKQVSEWLLQSVTTDDWGVADAASLRQSANDALQRIGLRVLPGGDPKRKAGGKLVPGVTYVAVASDHAGLAELFQGSRWNSGTWAQALRRAPGAVRYDRQRIGGRVTACTTLPITELVEIEEREAARQREKMDG